MTSLGLVELVIVGLNVILILAVPAAIIFAAIGVVRRTRSLEDRVSSLEKAILGQSDDSQIGRKDAG
jgi:hypothetical protein